MRGLTLRPDDRELFQSIADAEKTAFFMSHQDAFKRMWAEEGNVYWLRFLLAFKRNFETSIMVQPEYQFIFEEDEDERLVSFVFISIHDMFVHCAFNVVHTFISNIFIAIKHLHNLTEPTKVKNPFFTKESREAFRAILGRPDEHEDFPPALIAFALSIYGMFMGAVCIILKRWLKEPDLSEDVKKNIDYTYFYWKPPPDWMDEHFWASCFEKHLADTYKDELPKLLLTANIQNIFVENHDMDCFCYDNTENPNIFEMFRSSRDDTDSDYCIQHKGIVKPHVMRCNTHSNCYFKVLHSPKCLEPYLCEGSEQCKITCEKNLKAHSKTTNPTNTLKKGVVEVFSCKQPNMRHVSTLAQSHNTQIETFLHCRENDKAEITCKMHDEETEFMMELLHDPEMMNSFNQQKRKEEYKNKLRTKFRQKYCAGPKDFSDPDYCMNLFESAQKLWIMGVFEENFSKLKPFKHNADRTNLFETRESAETTVAVGTSCVLTGRIVTPLLKCGSQSSSKEVEKSKVVPGTSVVNEVKSKSKKSKKKKKNKLNNGSNDKNDAAPLSTTVEKKTESGVKTKESPVVVSEKRGDTSIKDSIKDAILEGKNITVIVKKVNGSVLTSEKNVTAIKKQELTKHLVKSDNTTLECKSKKCSDPTVKGDVDKEGDRLCFGRCPPQNPTSNGCSSKMCCPCVLCKKKELSTQNNISQNNSSVITEKPKKTGKKTELKTAMAKTDNTIQNIDASRQLATEDLNTNSVVSKTLSNVSVKAIEVNGTSSSNLQDKSCLDLKEKTVNQNIEQQCINDRNSSDLQTDQNACAEMAGISVINSVMNVSDGDVLDKYEATNGLTFETDEEKTVEDFLKLIGVINKPSISKDEHNPNGVESDANQKGNARLSDRKLKVCAYCTKKEVTHKTFKRCARCKAENFPEQLYYCSRQCQVDDWQESHMDEHAKRKKK